MKTSSNQMLRLLATASMVSMAAADGIATLYNISSADIGGCRLKGISESSDNFKYYASVSSKDSTLYESCARCIQVSRDNDGNTLSTYAYVLDVCESCDSGTVKLSGTAMSALSIDVQSSDTSVSYKFVTCPSSFMSGNVKACLMEGASNAYIPLQFYNSQKVISSVYINDIEATKNNDGYFFSVTTGQSDSMTSTWYKELTLSLTSNDDEVQNGTIAFSADSGCGTSDVQFSTASTSDSDNSSIASGAASSSTGVIIGVVCGVAAIVLIIGSIFFVRRRRAARQLDDNSPNDIENQYSTPKPKAPPSPAAPTYASERSNSGGDVDAELRSPTMAYSESFSPAASAASRSLKSSTGPTAAAAAVGAAVASSHASSEHTNSQRSAAAMDPTTNSYHSVDSNTSYRSHPVRASAAESTNSYGSELSSDSATQPAPPAPIVPAPEPTYSYSAYSRSLSTSPRSSSKFNPYRNSTQTVPTFTAPVIPPAMTSAYQYEDSDEEDQNAERTSFDVDDMRDTEEMKTTESSHDSRFSAAYSTPSAYASGATVTSPQSYVRATTLRRNTSGRRPSSTTPRMFSSAGYGRNANNSMISDSGYGHASNNQTMVSDNGVDVNPYASQRSNPPPASDTNVYSSQRSNAPVSEGNAYASQRSNAPSFSGPGSFRESAGYSRDSLSILGYPYAKKSGRNNSVTGR